MSDKIIQPNEVINRKRSRTCIPSFTNYVYTFYDNKSFISSIRINSVLLQINDL